MNRVGNTLELTPEINQHIYFCSAISVVGNPKFHRTERREIDVSQGDIWNIFSALWLSSFQSTSECKFQFRISIQIQSCEKACHFALGCASQGCNLRRRREFDGVDDSCIVFLPFWPQNSARPDEAFVPSFFLPSFLASSVCLDMRTINSYLSDGRKRFAASCEEERKGDTDKGNDGFTSR